MSLNRKYVYKTQLPLTFIVLSAILISFLMNNAAAAAILSTCDDVASRR